MNTPEPPLRQWTKFVTLLDCVPGRADKPGVGEKISILTFAHEGDIEAPLMLNLPDAQKLAASLLGILAHHGDAKANEVYERYFADDDDQPAPPEIEWENGPTVDPRDLAAVVYGRSPKKDYDPHQNIVPPAAIADWLLGSACPSCNQPFAVDDVKFEQWCLLAGKWAARWKVACPRCSTSHRMTVTCMPRRMRL